ncbi:hypothetical protein H2200_004522 [Cladophialophora chaetospira]|uniref:Uncharacterized protein n=1 Tax=Cladophialophora chaetospira TaxID=386627 RepID=A0AA38XD94_9EURO|nr:hypothetical protein H2200_004522 [Cladophialophora chaetospira]
MATPAGPSLSVDAQIQPSDIPKWGSAFPQPASSAQRDQQEPPTLCGAAITLRKSTKKYSGSRAATIGGVILLDDRPYLLTAAHIFLTPGSRNSKTCCDKCGADDYNRRLAPLSGNSWWHDLRGALEDIPQARSDCPRGRNCAAIERDADFVLSFKDKDLKSFSTSVMLPDLQIDVEQPSQVAPATGKAAWMNLDHGWALIDLGEIPESQCLNITWRRNYDLFTNSVRRFNGGIGLPSYPEQRDYYIATPRGALAAQLHAEINPLWLAGSTDGHSKLTWRVSYDHDLGDIGSWMIDPAGPELWGMVVSLGDGRAEVLPAATIFDDIKRAMGVERVALPEQEDEDEDYVATDYDIDSWEGTEANEAENEDLTQRVGGSGESDDGEL